VGERLERSGPEKFWSSDFEIYYQDLPVGMCEKRKNFCELNFGISG
jgi:hypothetical protein